MAKLIEKENDRHREALRYYESLGPSRTYADVARKFEVSQNSIQLWARSFGWEARADEHDAQTARRTIELAEQAGIETDAKARVRNLKLVKMAMLQLAKSMAGGNVRMNVRDLDHLIRLEQDLLAPPGEAGSATESADVADLGHLSVEELWDAILEEVEAIDRLVKHDADVRRSIAEGKVRALPRLPSVAPAGREPAVVG